MPGLIKARAKRGKGGVIRRLRRRLVAIIMGVVGVVVIGVLVMSSMNAQSSLDEVVNRSLDRALESRGEPGSDNSMGMEHLPVVWVDINESGVVLGTNQAMLSVDGSELSEVLSQAVASDTTSGRIAKYHLAWRSRIFEGGWRIAVADTSSIDAARVSQLTNDAWVAALGLAALFVIANVLARWVLKPVERAWEQQRQFVADASHELKTPLAVILANVQILRGESSGLQEESRRWVESTAYEAGRMKGLVEGLLELARTEEGAVARRDVDVDLSDAVEGEAMQFDAVAFERGCTIDAKVEEGLHVSGDPDQLERLVKTLLDNACKYASAQTTVTVVLARRGSQAELAVTNQGTPVDPEDLPHLFDRFYRSDKARARSTGGFGLGLAIARGTVESHGGRISVTSDAERGTCFLVKLPLSQRQS